MAADEKLGSVSLYQAAGEVIVSAGIAAYVRHKHTHAFAFEESVLRAVEMQGLIVAIAVNAQGRLERGDLIPGLHSPAEITGVPYLVYGCQELPEFLRKHSVRVRNQSYVHKTCFSDTKISISPDGMTKFRHICSMELFYSKDIDGKRCRLDADESGHCIKVLRHRAGDLINVIDGEGTLYSCRIVVDSHKGVEAQIVESTADWGSHDYSLTMAVCPTKNNDRYEWFAEKACEIGLDRIVPVIGEHSERRIFKKQRIEKILVSAAKQSLKAAVPSVDEPVSVREFIESCESDIKLICYCFEDEEHKRTSIKEALEKSEGHSISILIGPEGDFSADEASLAISKGFAPVHLGASRLRTETAALTAVASVYFNRM